VLPMPKPTEVLGVRCVPAARAAVDLARVVRRHDALPVLDAAVRNACSGEDLSAEVLIHDGLRGVRQARELIAYADPLAQCRQESHLRLILRDAGLPMPRPQLMVGPYVLDLGYGAERVGVEYDGSSHLDRQRLRADPTRHNWLEGHGWAMRYFTDHDLYRRPDQIALVVLAALERL